MTSVTAVPLVIVLVFAVVGSILLLAPERIRDAALRTNPNDRVLQRRDYLVQLRLAGAAILVTAVVVVLRLVFG